ncbi:MAG TPA: GDP-mannose 4,6-dehydratase [Thermoanaerobaculia bacterium]|nr:GDP-mannose 4,6-dehydratase [Thermoanaerobaculia bacterium]
MARSPSSKLCRGVLEVLRRGVPGEKYNLGGRSERTNLQIVDTICDLVEAERPAAENPALAGQGIRSYRDLRKFVADRPGHDRRYAIDDSKIERELGWAPRQSFEEGLRATVRWYLGHRGWCEAVKESGYGRERLGLGKQKEDVESEVQAG